ncbi:unnamed protein product [Cunninghamella blakesleeana]
MPTQSFLDPTTHTTHLTSIVPSWSLTQTSNRSIPLYITIISDQPNNNSISVLDAWLIGYFTYQPNKRSSTELPLSYDTLMKRTKPSNLDQETQTQQSTFILPTQANYDYSNYYGLTQQHYIQSVPSSGEPSSSRNRQYFEDPNSPTQIMYPYRSPSSTDTFATYGTTESLGISTSNIGQIPTTSTSSTLPTTSYSTSSSIQRSLSISTSKTPASTNIEIAPASVSPSPSSASLFSPTATTLSTNVAGGITSSSSSPFAHLLSHANLIIENDIHGMTEDWNEQEKQDRRRLVQFWRRQQENEIICHCKPIPPTNRANTVQEIIVSCIYWESNNDYFITSVDIIYLLEALIGAKFTTEEKNRVRRNLESFNPLTVSKMRPDSSDFFKLIMAFHHPKPRNIEKDLKVFAWSTLPTALKKIISKYSASYSSTASVTLDPYSSSSSSSVTSPPMPHPSTST